MFQIEGEIDKSKSKLVFLMVSKCTHLINNSYWATELPINMI